MAKNRDDDMQLGDAHDESPSTLLPMLIGGLVLIVIAMIVVVALV